MIRKTLLAAAALAALAAPAMAPRALAQTAAPGGDLVTPSAPPVDPAPPTVVIVPGQPAAPQVVTPTSPATAIPVRPNGPTGGPSVSSTPAPQGNTRIGQLTCDVSGTVAFVVGSSRDLACEFKPLNGPSERYTGTIRRIGIDVGVVSRGTMVWNVVNTGPDVRPGSLAGNYVGVSSNASVGLGLGSAALLGGSGDQVALQPLSIESNTGLNLAAGVTDMALRAAN